jgi:hypothetical protein
MFPPRILQLRKKRKIRPLEILKKDQKNKTLRNNKDSTKANPAERRNRRARDSTTHQKSSGKNYCSKLSQNIMKQKKTKKSD